MKVESNYSHSIMSNVLSIVTTNDFEGVDNFKHLYLMVCEALENGEGVSYEVLDLD